MTSMHVAVATSPRPASIVKERALLWDEGVVRMKIPAQLRAGTYSEKDLTVHFAQFVRPAKGGVIHFYIHTDSPDLYAGIEMTAAAKVYKKTLEDGRAFLYVDLVPAATPATHRLVVVDQPEIIPPNKAVILECPPPLKARICIYPHTWALGPNGLSAGDSQLARLLSEGWNVSKESDTEVWLNKGERSMIHHKRKQKK